MTICEHGFFLIFRISLNKNASCILIANLIMDFKHPVSEICSDLVRITFHWVIEKTVKDHSILF